MPAWLERATSLCSHLGLRTLRITPSVIHEHLSYRCSAGLDGQQRYERIVGKQIIDNYTHETVPTQFVEASGVRYAYRRFGKPGTVPLLFLEYFNRWLSPLAPDSLLVSSG
jgi:hypothetical protein